jgi:hypothetical protein
MKTKVLIVIASTILLTPVALSEKIFKLWPIDVKVSLDLVKLLDQIGTAYGVVTKSDVSHSVNAKIKFYEYTQVAYALPAGNPLESSVKYTLVNDSTVAGENWKKTVETKSPFNPAITKTYYSTGTGDPDANFQIGENSGVPLAVRDYTCDDVSRQSSGITSIKSRLFVRISNRLDGKADSVKNFIDRNPELITICEFQGGVLPKNGDREDDYNSDKKYIKSVGTTGAFRSKELNVPTAAYKDFYIDSATGLSPKSISGANFKNFSVIDLTVRTSGYKIGEK